METKLETALSRHPRICYYVLLACAATLAFAGTSLFLIVTGREGVWIQDAQPLYANFLVWGCQTIDQTVQAAQSGAGIALPYYTYNMGYGADVPMTMGSYLQDPVNIIPALMPNELIGISYPLMTWLRMVLAAFAFSSYSLSHGRSRKSTFVAALAYATCGFIVELGAFRHPKFIDWAVLLPLILQGCDKIFEKRSPALFTGMLFLQFFISIYYSYMSCIVVLVYCVIKYFFAPRQRSVRDFARLVGTFLLFGGIAFLVSGLFSIPQIMALLSQGRATSGGTVVPLAFTLKYYAKITAHFIGAAGTTDGMITGAVSTIGLLAFVLCGKHFNRDERKPWIIGLVICFAGVLIPFLGHVMNGMGYATDRWMLVLAFVCSNILAMTLPKLSSLDVQDWKRMKIGIAVVAVLTTLYGCAQIAMSDGWRGMIWPICMTCAFVVVFLVLKKLSAGSRPFAQAIGAAVCVLACATMTATFYCSPLGENWGTTFPKHGTTWANMSQRNPAAAVEELDDAGLYRYSLARVHNSMKNSALIHSVMGVDYYTSYYNQHVDDFRQGLGISDHHMNFSFIGSDSRLAIEQITGVKYYVVKSRDFWRVPYGFADTGIEHDGFHVFKNAHPVPLAYLAQGVIDNADYDALGMIQKQETLLQAAVVDEGKLKMEQAEVQTKFDSKQIPYTVSGSDGLSIDGNTISVTKKNATITLEFEGLAQSETYLCLYNLGFDPYLPSQLAQAKGDGASLKTKIRDVLYTVPTTYPITASIGDRTKTADPATPSHLRYGGKVDWVFNLAYSQEPATQMKISFQEVGEYTFDDMQIVCQPIRPVVEESAAIAEQGLNDLELHANGMSATTELADEDPHLAQFMFAYTPGWSATVDGQPAEVVRTDVAFLGVEVQGKGSHEIVLSYETPGIKAGAYMSLAGLLALVLAFGVRRFLRSRARATK